MGDENKTRYNAILQNKKVTVYSNNEYIRCYYSGVPSQNSLRFFNVIEIPSFLVSR